MQYLAPGLTLITAHGIIWIIAAFWPTGVDLCPTQIMALAQVFAILIKWKIHLFRSPTYGLLVGAISGQVPKAWIQGDNLNRGCILAPSVYSSLIRFMHGLLPGHSNLGMRKITTACTIAALLISRFSRQNARGQALSELKVLTKIVLTTPSCVVHMDLRGFTSPVKRAAELSAWRSWKLHKHAYWVCRPRSSIRRRQFNVHPRLQNEESTEKRKYVKNLEVW